MSFKEYLNEITDSERQKRKDNFERIQNNKWQTIHRNERNELKKEREDLGDLFISKSNVYRADQVDEDEYDLMVNIIIPGTIKTIKRLEYSLAHQEVGMDIWRMGKQLKKEKQHLIDLQTKVIPWMEKILN